MSNEKVPDPDEIRLQYERLKEIDEQEHQLRYERTLLLRERPWYRKFSSWIGIGTIIVSILTFSLNYFISHQKPQLTVTYNMPQTQIFFKAPLQSLTKLFFDEKPIENIYRATIQISNTGTVAIDKARFTDGPIRFTVSEVDGKENKSRTSIPLLLDILETSGAGQQKDRLEIASHYEPAEFSYLPSLLNPGENVEFDIYLSRVSKFNISCRGKFSNGEIVLKTGTDPVSSINPLAFIGIAIRTLLGNKWIAVFVLLFALATSALMSYGLIEFGRTCSWELTNIIIFLNAVTVCLFYLLSIFLTVLY